MHAVKMKVTNWLSLQVGNRRAFRRATLERGTNGLE